MWSNKPNLTYPYLASLNSRKKIRSYKMVQSKLQPKVNLKKLEIFSCPKCRFLSPDKQSLISHIETSHSNETSCSSETSRSDETSHSNETSCSGETSRLSESSHSSKTSRFDETSRLSETSRSNRKLQRNVGTKRHDETSYSNETSHFGEMSQRNDKSKRRVETSHSDENKFEIKSESDDNEGKSCCKKKNTAK